MHSPASESRLTPQVAECVLLEVKVFFASRLKSVVDDLIAKGMVKDARLNVFLVLQRLIVFAVKAISLVQTVRCVPSVLPGPLAKHAPRVSSVMTAQNVPGIGPARRAMSVHPTLIHGIVSPVLGTIPERTVSAVHKAVQGRGE